MFSSHLSSSSSLLSDQSHTVSYDTSINIAPTFENLCCLRIAYHKLMQNLGRFNKPTLQSISDICGVSVLISDTLRLPISYQGYSISLITLLTSSTRMVNSFIDLLLVIENFKKTPKSYKIPILTLRTLTALFFLVSSILRGIVFIQDVLKSDPSKRTQTPQSDFLFSSTPLIANNLTARHYAAMLFSGGMLTMLMSKTLIERNIPFLRTKMSIHYQTSRVFLESIHNIVFDKLEKSLNLGLSLVGPKNIAIVMMAHWLIETSERQQSRTVAAETGAILVIMPLLISFANTFGDDAGILSARTIGWIGYTCYVIPLVYLLCVCFFYSMFLGIQQFRSVRATLLDFESKLNQIKQDILSNQLNTDITHIALQQKTIKKLEKAILLINVAKKVAVWPVSFHKKDNVMKLLVAQNFIDHLSHLMAQYDAWSNIGHSIMISNETPVLSSLTKEKILTDQDSLQIVNDWHQSELSTHVLFNILVFVMGGDKLRVHSALHALNELKQHPEFLNYERSSQTETDDSIGVTEKADETIGIHWNERCFSLLMPFVKEYMGHLG